MSVSSPPTPPSPSTSPSPWSQLQQDLTRWWAQPSFEVDLRGVGVGFLSGCAKTLVSYPLDTIKANIQNSQTQLVNTNRQIYSRQGLRSFYAGVQYPMMFSMISSSSFFGVFYALRPYVPDQYWWMLAPAVGAFSGLVHAPIERLKIRRQVDARLASSWFSGMRITMIRDFFGYGLYMNGYQYWCRNTDLMETTYGKIIVSLLAGVPTTIAIYPIDTIKTNIQSRSQEGIIQTVQRLVQNSGTQWMHRGLLIQIMKTCPRTMVEIMLLSHIMGVPKALTEEEEK